jgi:hypothetical protein
MKMCAPGVSLRCGDRLDRTPTESPNRAFSMVAKTQDPPPDLRTHDPWQPPDDFKTLAARLGFQPNLDGSRGWQPIMMTFIDDQRCTIDASELHTIRSTETLGAAHDHDQQHSELQTITRPISSTKTLGAAHDHGQQHSELRTTRRYIDNPTRPSYRRPDQQPNQTVALPQSTARPDRGACIETPTRPTSSTENIETPTRPTSSTENIETPTRPTSITETPTSTTSFHLLKLDIETVFALRCVLLERVFELWGRGEVSFFTSSHSLSHLTSPHFLTM